MSVPKKRVSTAAVDACCSKTVQRRLSIVREVRSGIGLDLEEEIQAMPKRKEKRTPPRQSTGRSLTCYQVQFVLSISWNKLRKLRRYSIEEILMSRMYACDCTYTIVDG